MNRPRLLAIAGLLLNAFVWGLSWLPFRWLDERGLQSLWTTTLIYLIASTLIALTVMVQRPTSTQSATPRRNHDLVWLAVGAGLSSACFNWAVTIGSVVRVILLFYLMPIWAILLARWLLREPITSNAVLRIALALAGAVIVLWRPDLGMPIPQTLPDCLAIIGGAAFALTNVMLRRLSNVRSMTCAQAMFVGAWGIAGLLATLLAIQGVLSWPSPEPTRWLPGALVFALVFLMANLGLQYGAARLPANVTAIVMMSEVVFATGSSIAFGNERLTVALMLGGALVLSAAWLSARESVA